MVNSSYAWERFSKTVLESGRKIRYLFLQQAFPERLVCPQDVSMEKRQQCWKDASSYHSTVFVSWRHSPWWAAADPHRLSRTSSVHLSSSTFTPSWECLGKESRKAKIRASPPPETSTPLPWRPNPQAPLFLSLTTSHSLLSPLRQPYWPVWASDPPRASPPYDYVCV